MNSLLVLFCGVDDFLQSIFALLELTSTGERAEAVPANSFSDDE
jgi:hypothetical protein